MKKYNYKKKILIMLLSLFSLLLTACGINSGELYKLIEVSTETTADRVTVEFVRHIDGDTTVFLVDGEETTVRYLAIDTEETVHPTEEATEQGQIASDYVKEKLENATIIELEFDENSDSEDYYGRLLAWVWVDNELLQLELIEKNLATVAYVYGDYKYLDLLYDAEN